MLGSPLGAPLTDKLGLPEKATEGVEVGLLLGAPLRDKLGLVEEATEGVAEGLLEGDSEGEGAKSKIADSGRFNDVAYPRFKMLLYRTSRSMRKCFDRPLT